MRKVVNLSFPKDLLYFVIFQCKIEFSLRKCEQNNDFSGFDFQVDVTNQSSSGGVIYFQLNGEWILRGFPVRRHVITYPSGNSYPDVSFWVVMER